MARLTCALGPDNAGRCVAALLRGATTAIDVSVYEIGDAWMGALAEAAGRGVAVKLVVDPRSDPDVRDRVLELERRGVDGRLLAHPDSLAHAKLIVVDDLAIAVGSGNLNGRDLPWRQGTHIHELAGTREWWVTVHGAPTLARVARTHVLRNWRLGTPALGVTPDESVGAAPPVRPEHDEAAALEVELNPRRLRLATGGAGVRTLQQDLINGVRKRCLITVPYVSAAAPAVAPLLGALTTHARRGIDVRLLLGQPPASASDVATLAHIEADVRVMDSAHVASATTGHAKGVICDDVVVVGSANWSEAGLTTNDEAAVAINHAAAATYYVNAFDRDWELALPLHPV